MTDEQILLLVADIKAGRKGDVLASPVPLPFRWRVWAWLRGLEVIEYERTDKYIEEQRKNGWRGWKWFSPRKEYSDDIYETTIVVNK